jgi:hypothetical protein
MCCYVIGNGRPAYDLLKYEENESIDYRYFLAGPRVDTASVVFTVQKKQFLKWAPTTHIFETLGPILIDNKLKEIINEIASSEVDFYPAVIKYEHGLIKNFYAIRPKTLASCYNLELSEYDKTVYDVFSEYEFSYIVLIDNIPYDLNIVRCEENPNFLVVSNKIKEACYKSKMKGMEFWRTYDETPQGRDICEKIK